MSIPIVGGLVSKAKDFLSGIKKIKKKKVIENNNNKCDSITTDKVNLSPMARDTLACQKIAHGGGSRGYISRSGGMG